MPPLSRRSSWPLYLQIADDLRKQIMRQELRPGERLPSEHSLMERYGASRQTVRKAVAVLKTEGLLDAAQGQGVFVRKRAPMLRRLSRREWETDLSGGSVFENRILIGPPHHQMLKDHLLRLAELSTSRSGGPKTVFASMIEDVTYDAERFFVASERAAVATLPSVNSPANFDTA